MALDSDLTSVINGNTAFAIELYRQLSDKPGNVLFSPYSISVALAMTYAGARRDTEQQMAHTLHFTLERDRLHPAFTALQERLSVVQQAGQVKLGIANSIWPQERYPFLPEFIATLKDCYGVEITPLDYGRAEEARAIINGWVEAKTERKITELLPKDILDALVRLVLVNAIYFKGNWASQFDPKHTHEAPFWIAPDHSVTVPLMHQTASRRYGQFGDVQVLELPYAGGDLSMLVVLPDKVDGLEAVETILTAEQIRTWSQRLQKREVEVFLPKFKTEFAVTLNEALTNMGMPDAFSSKLADFSGMDGYIWLYIAYVLHKAFIDVNEEGTEAAAATAVIMIARGLPMSLTVRADHPFIFVIRDNSTGSILFMGRVVNPAP